MKPLLLQTLDNENNFRPPVWLMRQAGRYLSEYQAIKSKYGFLQMCKTPELACEVTLQPIRIFEPDAAIIFADIMLPAESLGFKISFNPGPVVENKIKDLNDVNNLNHNYNISNLSYLAESLKLVKSQLRKEDRPKALIGFAAAPYTLACYLIEQGLWKHFLGTQVFAAQQRTAFEKLLTLLTELTNEYLALQIEAGADLIQIFDTWGGNLSLEDYKKLSLESTQNVITNIKKKNVHCIHYVNNCSHLIPAMLESGASAISIDWRSNLEIIARETNLALQGNFDPTHLFLCKDEVIKKSKEMLNSVNFKHNYIANLGHGILPNTPRENVQAFIETVKSFKYTKPTLNFPI